MTFYLLFLFVITLFVALSLLYPEKSKIYEISLLVFAIVISVFRDNISGDYRSYIYWYETGKRDYDFEFGFVWLMNLFKWFHFSYHVFFFFVSFITIMLVYLGVKKYTLHNSIAFLFFLLIPALYLNSWSIIRQAFAMSIVFYAFQFLISKKYLIYFFLMLVGFAIHYSVILPFFAFLFVYKFANKIKTVHLAVLLFFSLVISTIHWSVFFSVFFESTRYIAYFPKNIVPVNGLKIISLNVLAVFILFYSRRLVEENPFQKYFVVFCVFSIVMTNLFATNNQLERFSYYFTLFEIIVFADLFFLETKNRRIVLCLGCYLYGISLFLYTIKADYNLNKQGTKYIPYNSVFYKFDDPFFMMGTDYLIDPTLAKERK